MLILIAAVVLSAGIGATNPKAVKKAGCVVTFELPKACHAPAPQAPQTPQTPK